MNSLTRAIVGKYDESPVGAAHSMLSLAALVAEMQDQGVSAEALLRGTGARGLRAILEEVLQQVMFEVPSRDDVERVLITRGVVLENVNPTLVPREVPRDKRPPREKSA